MSIPFNQDASVQQTYTTFPYTITNVDTYVTSNYVLTASNQIINKINSDIGTVNTNLTNNYYNKTSTDTLLNAKQANLSFTTPLANSGNTVSINLSAYSTTGNDASYYTKSSTDTLLNAKQNTLTSATTLLGNGNAITNINYNNIPNRLTFLSPLSSNATNQVSIDLSSYSTTATINNQITNTSNYILNTQNTLQTNINTNLLYSSNFTTGTSNILVSRILNEVTTAQTTLQTNINTNLLYSSNFTTGTSNILVSRIISEQINTSNYVFSKFLPLIGGTLTNTLNGPTINATTNLQENGTNLSAKYLLLSGGILTGAITTNSTTGGNLITLNTSSTTATSAISFKNTTNNFGYVGLGCVAYPNNYASNLFLETTNDVIVNSGGFSATPKMILKSSGNVGIGILNPNCRLYISANLAASATVYAMRLSCGAATDGGGFGTLLGLGSEPNGWSKCAIGHTRTGNYDRGAIVFLTRDTQDGADCTMADERMRISSTGGVAIGNNDPYNYKLFVNGVTYINDNLKVAGIANIHNNSPYAVVNNFMAIGSLTIGGLTANYGCGNNWTSNTAGLMMECLDNTEIMIHDSGSRLVSAMAYYGGATNRIYIGRDAGWGSTPVTISNNLTINGNVSCAGKITLLGELVNGNWKMTNDSDYCRLYNSAGTTYFNFAAKTIYASDSLIVVLNGSFAGTLYVGQATTIRAIVNDRGSYDHSQAPLTITNQTVTGTTLNDSLPVLNLCRQGVGGVAYGARATMCLSRFENVNLWSRTRLDFKLASDTYNDVFAMTLRSDGNTYFYPNPQYINNTNGANYAVNLNVACFTTGYATAPFISCIVNDGWNGIDTSTIITAQSGANSGYWNGSRIYLDGSYNTNSGSGSYGSKINFQSQGSGGSWGTNAIFATTTGGGGTIVSHFYFYGTVYYYSLSAITSDIITKKDIIKITDALNKIEKINGIEYISILTDEKRVGIIAQDVEKVYPELVSTDEEGIKGVCYTSLIGLLVEGIKELNKNNQELKDELNQIKEDMKQMKELLYQFSQKV